MAPLAAPDDGAFFLHLIQGTHLHAADRLLKDSGLQQLFHAVGEESALWRTLDTLDISGNDLHGGHQLVQLLEYCKNAHTLKAEWNRLNLSELIDVLKHHPSLTHIDLRNNRLQSDDAFALAQIIQYNTTIKHIDLRWNSLSDGVKTHLVDAVKHNRTLQTMPMSGNMAKKEELMAIEAYLQRNRHIAQTRAAGDDAKKIKELEEHQRQLHTRLEIIAENEHSKVNDIAALRKQLALEEERNADLIAQRDAEKMRHESAEHDLNVRLHSYELKNAQLEAQLSEANHKLLIAEKDRSLYAHRVDQLDVELKTLEERHSRLLNSQAEHYSQSQHHKTMLEQEISRLTSELSGTDKAYREQVAAFESQLHSRERLETDMQLNEQQLSKRQNMLDSELSQLRRTHTSQLEQLHVKIQTLTDQYKESERIIDSLQGKLAEQKREFEQKLIDAEHSISLRYRKEHEADVDDFKKKAASFEEHRDELLRKLAATSAEKQDALELKLALQSTKRELTDVKACLEQERQKHADLRDENMRYKLELDALHHRHRNLEDEQKSQNSRLLKEQTNWHKRYESLLHQHRMEVQQLQATITQQQYEIKVSEALRLEVMRVHHSVHTAMNGLKTSIGEIQTAFSPTSHSQLLLGQSNVAGLALPSSSSSLQIHPASNYPIFPTANSVPQPACNIPDAFASNDELDVSQSLPDVSSSSKKHHRLKKSHSSKQCSRQNNEENEINATKSTS